MVVATFRCSDEFGPGFFLHRLGSGRGDAGAGLFAGSHQPPRAGYQLPVVKSETGENMKTTKPLSELSERELRAQAKTARQAAREIMDLEPHEVRSRGRDQILAALEAASETVKAVEGELERREEASRPARQEPSLL